MDQQERIDDCQGSGSGSAVPGNSGTVPEQKDVNPPPEGKEGAQDIQPVEGEAVLHRPPESDLIQRPFPQG